MKNYIQNLVITLALLAGFQRVGAATVSLDWNASASDDVVAYNLYYGTTSGNYTAKISFGNVTNVTISDLTAGVTYYFAATAVDTNGNESGFSNETSYIVPGVLALSQGNEAGGPAVLNFPVEPSHWYEIQATTDFQSWTTIGQTGVATSNAWVQFSDPAAPSLASRFYRLVLH